MTKKVCAWPGCTIVTGLVPDTRVFDGKVFYHCVGAKAHSFTVRRLLRAAAEKLLRKP